MIKNLLARMKARKESVYNKRIEKAELEYKALQTRRKAAEATEKLRKEKASIKKLENARYREAAQGFKKIIKSTKKAIDKNQKKEGTQPIKNNPYEVRNVFETSKKEGYDPYKVRRVL